MRFGTKGSRNQQNFTEGNKANEGGEEFCQECAILRNLQGKAATRKAIGNSEMDGAAGAYGRLALRLQPVACKTRTLKLCQ
jgi:hypothetical protein